jgi:Cu-Zn family superoxide dismutase
MGSVIFTREDKGMRITAEVHGLTPGAHGFHIHQYGDCSASDAASAGAHFNPTGEPHGGPDSEKRHTGDTGNLVAGQDGIAKIDISDNRIALEGEQSILGRAVVVHVQPDDFKTQPTGGAGARVACGVIGAAK